MIDGADGRAGIDAGLVRRLVAAQFPRWAGLPVTPVPVDGWDNRTYRLGRELTVRLPTHRRYVAAVVKEDRWLPALGRALPVAVPEPVGTGRPGSGYPFPWSIRRWLPGEPARTDAVADSVRFATDLADVLRALRRMDATGGPPAGEHSFHRGGNLAHYHDETRRALSALAGRLDTARAAAVWAAALRTRWDRPPVWFHGDVAVGNLLVRNGRLAAVIDFGTCGVGDPACDLVIAWTLLAGAARDAFRHRVGLDPDTWARARGWALWKALIGLAAPDADPATVEPNRLVVDRLIAEHAAARPAP